MRRGLWIGLVAVVLFAVLQMAGRASAQQVATPQAGAAIAHPAASPNQQQGSAKPMEDFADLARYRAASQALAAPHAGEQRVIFFGDSITDGWHLDTYFPGKSYINRGISGQTTSQMLLRFRQDVIDLQPHVLLILAGTNDIAGNTGPISVADIERNYASMAELARVHHIVTIFSSVMPVNGDAPAHRDFFEARPAAEILALNEWMKQYCASNGDIYLDYYSAMVDERGQMKRALSDDGLHPNDAGYKVMVPLAQSAIEKALQY